MKLLEKGRKLINLMKAISAHSWGCHPSTLLAIYKGLVRPTIEWGNTIYAQADKRLLAKINTLQNEALRIVSGCFRTTPLNILHHSTGVQSLEIRRQTQAAKFLAKKYATINSPLIPKLKLLEALRKRKAKNFAATKANIFFHAWVRLEQEFAKIIRTRNSASFEIPYGAYFIREAINTTKGDDIRGCSDPNTEFHKFVSDFFPESTHIFTDGSKTLILPVGSVLFLQIFDVSTTYQE